MGLLSLKGMLLLYSHEKVIGLTPPEAVMDKLPLACPQVASCEITLVIAGAPRLPTLTIVSVLQPLASVTVTP